MSLILFLLLSVSVDNGWIDLVNSQTLEMRYDTFPNPNYLDKMPTVPLQDCTPYEFQPDSEALKQINQGGQIFDIINNTISDVKQIKKDVKRGFKYAVIGTTIVSCSVVGIFIIDLIRLCKGR